jgi:hypothetical protein
MVVVRRIFLTLIVALLLNLVSSCNVNNDGAAKTFFNLYSNCSMNTEIVIPLTNYEFKSDEMIDVPLKNNSQQTVIFPVDFNVKLLVFNRDQGNWEEQVNNMEYFPFSPIEDNVILDVTNDFSRLGGLFILPAFSGGSSNEIRVVVTGLVYKDNITTNKCVGAFADIFIKP